VVLDRRVKQIETRNATPTPVEPPLNLEALVEAAVDRAVAAKIQARDGDSDGNATTAQEPMYYTGTWDTEATYCRNAVTTDHGTLWFCEADSTTDRPGSSPAWKLMVKSFGKHNSRKHAGAGAS
jgi:hypothetical protein